MKKLFAVVFIAVAIFSFKEKPTVKRPLVAVQTWTFHHWSFLESIDKADSLGIRYLEVYPGQLVGGGIPGAFTYTLDADARAKLKDYLQYKKVKVIALGVVDKYYYTRENLEEYFKFCRDMQIPFMTAEPEPADLDLFNSLGMKYNIKVALHAHPKPESHYWHPDSAVKAMKGRKMIGAWPDIGHWARNGANVVDGLKKMQGKLWGMHFKDIEAFDKVEAVDVLFGKGVCNLPGVAAELKRQGFAGVITMEYEANDWNNMGDMRGNKKYCDSLFNAVYH